MRVLITGYSGFLGQNIIDQFANVFQLHLLGRKHSNIGDVFLQNLDINSNYKDALKDVEVVVHCAARAHLMEDKERDPLSKFRAINTDATLNLARQASQAGVKRFIFVSTIKVNGESTTGALPFKSTDLYKPKEPYAISKAEAEYHLLELGNETGMEIVIIRPPLIYGEGVKGNFASLMKYVDKGFPLPFRIIKNNKRSLVSVYNLVDLIKVCIKHPKAANQIFLVSDDHDISTSEMISLMAKVQEKNNHSFPVPVWCFKLIGILLNKKDFFDRLTGSLQLDITHTKKILNWTPPYSIEYGFRRATQKTEQNN